MYRLHCFCQSGNSYYRFTRYFATYLFYPLEESGYEVRLRFPGIAAWLERLKVIPGWALPYHILPGERIAPKWTC